MLPQPERQASQQTAGERTGPIAQVAIAQPLDRLYSYSVPDEMVGVVKPGCRVRVPLGRSNRPATGFCISVSNETWLTTLKPISQVLDDSPLLDEHLLELGRWISRYYACPLGLTLDAMVPAAVKAARGKSRFARWLGPKAETPDHEPLRALLRSLGPAQKRLAEVLAASENPITVRDLLARAGCTAGPLRALVRNGLVEITDQPDADAEAELLLGTESPAEPPFELNEDQARALASIEPLLRQPAFRVFLLFGVTGSGKTEVYIRAIRQVVASGRQALLLVPEIALTTQTVQRLTSRLPAMVVLHSGLTESQRAKAWHLIAAGKAKVVVGTRSAVFAPCPDLGLIVIDEEQEPSYKNVQAPRFHCRDVAIKRAQLLGIPVVLGSATPSLETWLNAHHLDHYELLRLPKRVRDLPLPAVTVVDMRLEHRARPGIHLLGRLMEKHLRETLDRGEQAVLLLNRRGYASYIFCASCGRRIVCPRCRVNMVFHSTAGQARCHYCGCHFPVPDRCPAPGCGHKLVRFGMGTQRVEEELKRKFPDARISRVDSDAVSRPAEFARILSDFESGRVNVLIGTQMVAKGLDFPFVSFVGVVSADTALALPDFRAAERTFQLVTQVAGRAGRAERPGTVVVQTFAADLVAVRAAVRHDYEQFARSELASRKRMRLPPYWRLTRILLADRRREKVRTAAEDLARQLDPLLAAAPDQADIIGPQPSPIERMRDKWRYDVLLRTSTARAMMAVLDKVRSQGLLQKLPVQQVTVDVDPVSLA